MTAHAISSLIRREDLENQTFHLLPGRRRRWWYIGENRFSSRPHLAAPFWSETFHCNSGIEFSSSSSPKQLELNSLKHTIHIIGNLIMFLYIRREIEYIEVNWVFFSLPLPLLAVAREHQKDDFSLGKFPSTWDGFLAAFHGVRKGKRRKYWLRLNKNSKLSEMNRYSVRFSPAGSSRDESRWR